MDERTVITTLCKRCKLPLDLDLTELSDAEKTSMEMHGYSAEHDAGQCPPEVAARMIEEAPLHSYRVSILIHRDEEEIEAGRVSTTVQGTSFIEAADDAAAALGELWSKLASMGGMIDS